MIGNEVQGAWLMAVQYDITRGPTTAGFVTRGPLTRQQPVTRAACVNGGAATWVNGPPMTIQ